MLKRDQKSQEDFVVRGILDGYLLYEDRIILFDYKTDRYDQPIQLIDRYRGQLALYGEALSRAYSIENIEKYLILHHTTYQRLLPEPANQVLLRFARSVDLQGP